MSAEIISGNEKRGDIRDKRLGSLKYGSMQMRKMGVPDIAEWPDDI